MDFFKSFQKKKKKKKKKKYEKKMKNKSFYKSVEFEGISKIYHY